MDHPFAYCDYYVARFRIGQNKSEIMTKASRQARLKSEVSSANAVSNGGMGHGNLK